MTVKKNVTRKKEKVDFLNKRKIDEREKEKRMIMYLGK
jgi:hypothetical protein